MPRATRGHVRDRVLQARAARRRRGASAAVVELGIRYLERRRRRAAGVEPARVVADRLIAAGANPRDDLGDLLRTDSGAGTSARSSCASATGSPASVRRSDRIDALQQTVDRRRPQPVGDRVGDQARRAEGDLLADDEAVLAQRRAGRGQVDDRLGEPGQRRELDRSLDLDDLGLAPGLEKVPRGDARVLGRDPDDARGVAAPPAARSSPSTLASTIRQRP